MPVKWRKCPGPSKSEKKKKKEKKSSYHINSTFDGHSKFAIRQAQRRLLGVDIPNFFKKRKAKPNDW